MPGIVTAYVLIEIEAIGDDCTVFGTVILQIFLDGLLEVKVPEYLVT